MKHQFRVLAIAALLTLLLTQGTLWSPMHAQAAAHAHYFLGLSQQATITLRNPSAEPIALLLTAFDASGVQVNDGALRVEVPAASSKDLRAAELPEGTATLRVTSERVFDAYAYADAGAGVRAEFLPALKAGARILRFPQLYKGDVAAKRITLFNPNEQATTAELVALDESGSELARAFGGVLLPRQTLEVAAGALLSATPEAVAAVTVESPIALIGQQRITLPRGDTLTLPAYVDVEGGGAEPLLALPPSDGGLRTKPQNKPVEVSSVAASAAASLDDYPFRDYPYCPLNVNAANCPTESHDPYGFFHRECTSFVAWRMNRDAGTPDPRHPSFTNTMKGGHWGDGGNWYDNALKLKYKVDNIPEVGAIAQWRKNECSGCTFGHVAYVESVSADGRTVNLSEYNFGKDYKFSYRYRTNVPISGVGHFIHIPKPASSPARPVVTSSLRVLTQSPLTVDQRVQITFVVTNRGGKPITFQRLLAGGRRGGDPSCKVGGCPDFPSLTDVTLSPGQSVTYTQTQTFATPDRYNFFVAYLTNAGWVTSVETDSGVGNAVDVRINPKPPTVTSYSWSATPKGNILFGGTIKGTNFVSGGTQVWFCVNKKDTCYQHPSSGVDVQSSTQVSIRNVKLSSGSWQVYVETAGGLSKRSEPFTVK
jgi:surface antigen